ncbi:MAG: SDR family oxidoreductase [Ignavibacteriales bacterium]|nr:SDR family oxidoreductase [Ignavibacteriales bacterium]
MKRIALVTASSKGIGFAAAKELLEAGCTVILSSSNSSNLAKSFSELNAKYPGKVLSVLCNLRDRGNVKKVAKELIEEHQSIDILVNNCGGPAAGFFESFSDEQWDEAFQEIFQTARIFGEAFIPGMQIKKWGRIVNITSVAVKHYIDNLILSTSMRSALTAYTTILSKQIAGFGITINNVAPGFTLTERIYELAEKRAAIAGISIEEMLQSMEKNVPAGRFAKPEEIADAIGFLCSDKASYITGNTILIDGGLSRSII